MRFVSFMLANMYFAAFIRLSWFWGTSFRSMAFVETLSSTPLWIVVHFPCSLVFVLIFHQTQWHRAQSRRIIPQIFPSPSQCPLFLQCIMMLSIKLLNTFLTLPPYAEHWCFIFHSNTSTEEQLMMSAYWYHFWNIFRNWESWRYNHKNAHTCLFSIWCRNRIGLLINAFW